ncbi:MAG: hypothetical protein WA966_10435 [Ornithinimicrobium sp.]
MFVVGAILIVLAIIVVIYVTFATRNLDPLSIDWGPFTAALTPLQLFFLGAASILVLAIGAVMFSIGLRTQGVKRAEVKRLRKEVEKSQAEQPPSRDSGTSEKSGRDSSQREKDSTTAVDTSDRRAGSGTSQDTGSQKQTSKLPPPLPPRDSTPPPPRSGV